MSLPTNRPIFINSDLGIQVLQNWCVNNHFDPYVAFGLRPAYFEHGVRGIEGIPPLSNSSPITAISFKNCISSANNEHNNIVSSVESALESELGELHHKRNHIHFSYNTHQNDENNSNLDTNPSELYTTGCYSYRYHEELVKNEQNTPILQIPYNLVLSPSRLLYSNPLLLGLSAQIIQLHNKNIFNIILQSHIPQNQFLKNHDTMKVKPEEITLCEVLYTHYINHAAHSNKTIAYLKNTLLSPQTLQDITTVLNFATNTPILSDLDIFNLSIIENCRIFQNLAKMSNNQGGENTSRYMKVVNTPVAINILPYILALPQSYDTPLNWDWDELGMVTFTHPINHSHEIKNPNEHKNNIDNILLNPTLSMIYSDIILRLFEWLRLCLILHVTNIHIASQVLHIQKETSSSSTHQFQELSLLSRLFLLSDSSADGNIPLITFAEYLYAYSTVATRSVHTPSPPIPPQSSSLPFSTSASLHFLPTHILATHSTLSSNISIHHDDINNPQYLSRVALNYAKYQSNIAANTPIRDAILTSVLYLHNMQPADDTITFHPNHSQNRNNTNHNLSLNFLSQIYNEYRNGIEKITQNAFNISIFDLLLTSLTTLHLSTTISYIKHPYQRYQSIARDILSLIPFTTHLSNNASNHPNLRQITVELMLNANFDIISDFAPQYLTINTPYSSILPPSDQALIPFFDLLNHSDKISVSVQWDDLMANTNLMKKDIKIKREKDRKNTKGDDKNRKNHSGPISHNSTSYYCYSILREASPSNKCTIPFYPFFIPQNFQTEEQKDQKDIQIDYNSEVFISYGALSNIDLFTRYGFVLPSNIHETYPITLKSVNSVLKSYMLSTQNSMLSLPAQTRTRPITNNVHRPPVVRPIIGRSVVIKPGSNIHQNVSNINNFATPPQTPIITLTQTSIQLLNRLGLGNLVNMTEKYPQSEEQRNKNENITFKLHINGLPFDLFAYLSVIIIQTTQTYNQNVLNNIQSTIDCLSNELCVDLQHYSALVGIVSDLLYLVISETYLPYLKMWSEKFEDGEQFPVLTFVEITLKQHLINLKSSITSQRYQYQREIDQINQLRSEFSTLLIHFIKQLNSQNLLKTGNYIISSDYWMFITQSFIESHTQVLFASLIGALTLNF